MSNYMGMTDEQVRLHSEMMSKPMSEYPRPLKNRLYSLDSICGEVIAEEVATYIMLIHHDELRQNLDALPGWLRRLVVGYGRFRIRRGG